MRRHAALLVVGSSIVVAGCSGETPAHAGPGPHVAAPRPIGADVQLEAVAAGEWSVRGAVFTASLSAERVSFATRDHAPAIDVRTTSIRRGSAGWTTADLSRAAAHGSTLSVERASFVEEWRAGPEHLEQSWRFDERPAGHGPLVVDLQVPDASLRVTDAGVEIGTGGEALLYSHAVWIDASGRRVAIRCDVEGDRISIVVPEEVLESAVFPAVLDPTLGPIHSLDPVPLGAVATGEEYAWPIVVWNGTDYVVLSARAHDPSAVAIRLAADGTPLDTPEREVPFYGSHAFWDGTAYRMFAVRTGGSLVTAALTTGLVGDAGTTLLSSGVAGLDVAFDGTSTYLCVWQSSPSEIFGIRVGTTGALLDAAPFVIATGPGYRNDPEVAWLGDRFYVVYTDDRYVEVRSTDVRGTAVSRDGVVATTDGVEIAVGATDYEDSAHVIAGPTTSIVAFRHRPSSGAPTTLRMRTLDASGALVSGVPVLLDAVSTTSATVHALDGVWTGSDFILAWGENAPANLDAARVSADGSVVSDYPLSPFPYIRYQLSMAWSGSDGILAWAGWPSSGAMLYVDRLGPTGSLGQIPLITGAPFHQGVRADGDERGALAVFVDGSPSGGALHAVALGPDGAPMGPATTLPISTATSFDLARGDTNYLLTIWRTDRIEQHTIAADASYLAPGTLRIPRLSDWDVARRPGGYFLVSSNSYAQPSVQPLGASGDPAGSAILLSTAGRIDGDVAIARGTAANYLVVWTDSRAFSSNQHDIYAMRIAEDGSVIDRSSLPVTATALEERAPRATATGDGWIVSWTEMADTVRSRRVFAHVSADGVVAARGAFPEVAAAPAFREERSAWGGGHAVIVWMDALGATTGDARLLSQTFAADGSLASSVETIADPLLTDRTRFSVPYEWLGDLVPIAADHFLFVYVGRDPAERFPRAVARALWLDSPLGAPCSAAAECTSGACVDGVCCAEACGGGDPADCQACSVAAGGAADGICTPVRAGLECRSSTGTCDVAETCSGSSIACPADASAMDGTPCANADACDGVETCLAGACVPGAPPVCADADACTIDGCDSASGCTHVAIEGCGDAGVPDAGAGDAGVDGGAPSDAGGPLDAGVDASAAVDGGAALDGGAGVDAGDPARDASVAFDSGPAPSAPASGCSCRVSTTDRVPHAGLVMLALALVASRLRRGRRSRH